jgi:hypothetical protein
VYGISDGFYCDLSNIDTLYEHMILSTENHSVLFDYIQANFKYIKDLLKSHNKDMYSVYDSLMDEEEKIQTYINEHPELATYKQLKYTLTFGNAIFKNKSKLDSYISSII